eukprot:SAG11_NODE_11257_length_773_cov_1.476261_2_plen_104_part_01
MGHTAVLRWCGGEWAQVPVSWEANGGDFIRSNISRLLLTHKATMPALRPRTRYGYRVGNNASGWSSGAGLVFVFHPQPPPRLLLRLLLRSRGRRRRRRRAEFFF